MTSTQTEFKARLENTLKCAMTLARKDMALERELHQTKWFDYRFISPMEATLQFRADFTEIHKRKYAINVKTEGADKRTGVSSKLPLSSKTELTTFWRARQAADRYGLPYKIFIEAAFDYFIRRGWERLPHINQLYATKTLDAICVAAGESWIEFQDCYFERSFSHAREYRTEAFHSFPSQIAHREWVVAIVKAKATAWRIGRVIIIDRVMLPEVGLKEYGAYRIERATTEVAGDASITLETIDAEHILPSCFGLPGALAPQSPECVACPAGAQCSQFTKVILAHLEKVVGSNDPEHDRRKKQQRDRTARCRSKKLAVLSASGSTLAPVHSAAGN